MPLVKPLSNIEDKETQELVTFFNETLGFCPNSVLTMQKKPHLAQAFVNLNKAVMDNAGSISSEFKRIIAYISSNTAGCRYCQAHTISCLLYTSPSPRDRQKSRMPSSA